jgi:hypothetical protein
VDLEFRDPHGRGTLRTWHESLGTVRRLVGEKLRRRDLQPTAEATASRDPLARACEVRRQCAVWQYGVAVVARDLPALAVAQLVVGKRDERQYGAAAETARGVAEVASAREMRSHGLRREPLAARERTRNQAQRTGFAFVGVGLSRAEKPTAKDWRRYVVDVVLAATEIEPHSMAIALELHEVKTSLVLEAEDTHSLGCRLLGQRDAVQFLL